MRKPSIKGFHVFGFKCMAQIPKIFRKKLDKKGAPRIFVRYKDDSNIFKVFEPDKKNK